MISPARFLLACASAAILSTTITACQKKPKRVVKTAEKQPSSSVDARYNAARHLLLNEKFAESAAAFAELSEEPDIRQPLQNWITVLHGMALLLDGREPESRKIFAQLVERGPFSEAPDDAAMAKFFVTIGTTLSSDAVIPATVAKDFDKWSFEGIVFMLYGLKDWNLDNFDEAVPLFRQFAGVAPERMVLWADGPPELAKMKEIAEKCVNDYLEYQPAQEALTKASTPEQQFEAVEKARAARAKMQLTSKLSRELDAKIAEIGPKVAAIMAEKDKMSSDELAFDAKELPAAKQKRTELHSKFMFAEARQAILDPALKTEKARDEQQLLAKKSQWLANFKDQLLEDLNAKGYAQPLTSRQGAPIAGGIARADAQQVYVNSPRGLVPVPWSEIAPDSAFTIARSFIPDDLPPNIMAFRKWHLGVFASFAGKSESLPLLKEAAELRPIFGEELYLFEKPVEDW